MPRFSLVIPTLQRSDTLRHSLATLVNQVYDDFEIVVQNNGRDGATEAVIDSFDNRRIRHFWSDSVLPMAENWELALANTTGEFVTFVGDDDGLFPDACRLADGILQRTSVEIVNWRPFCYYWPNYIFPDLRNRLIADIDYNVKIRLMSSRHQLQRFYRFILHYSLLPMIYNSFVARKAIQRVIARAGRYFFGVCPDVTSGIVNAESTKEFAFITRPLSMTGISGHSTGHGVALSPRGWMSPERVKRSMGVSQVDPRLVPTSNLEIMLANDALLVRDLLFPHDRETEVDFRRLIQSVASSINDRPGFYDSTQEAIETLARQHDIAVSDIAIPRVTNATPQLDCGAVVRGPGQISFVMDGNALGLNAIDDAIRIAGQLTPKIENVASLELERTETSDRVVVGPGVKVAFGTGGVGVPGLDYGWGAVEQWGTWSVGKQAHLRLATLPAAKRPLDFDLFFRTFVHTKHRQTQVEIWANGSKITGWALNDPMPKLYRLTVPVGCVGPNGAIDLEFRIANPCSPLELGASTDARLLGIGLEWLWCRPTETDKSSRGPLGLLRLISIFLSWVGRQVWT